MPPQTPMPTQVPTNPINPVMMALLRARAAQTAGGTPPVTPAPNGLPLHGAAPPPAPTAAAAPMAGRSTATPAQKLMKAATPATSPMMDPQTRQIAKQLIQKLMQHM